MEEQEDEDFDLMSELFYRDLDQPLQRIFLALDSVSLKTSRQVCKDWGIFIKRRIWGSNPGSFPYRTLRSKLEHHWRHATPDVRTVSLLETGGDDPYPPFSSHVHCVSCDDYVVICGMKNAEARVFDIQTLELVTVLDCSIEDLGEHGEVQQDIGKEVVCTVTEKGDVSVWRRRDWSLLYKSSHHGKVEVYGVRVVKEYIITGGCDGRIAVLRWNGQEFIGPSMLGESPISPKTNRRNIMEDEMMINHIDSDGVWILAGSSMKLNLWSLKDCKKVKSLNTSWINSLSLCYPFALTVGNAKGVIVWDLEKGDHLRSFGKEMFWQVHKNGSFFGASIANMPWDSKKDQSVMLYSIGELTNDKLSPDNLWKRRKYLESGSNKVVSCALNTSCLVTAQGNNVHVWDFWNCNSFEDDPDPERPEADISEDDDDEDELLVAEADQDMLVALNLIAQNVHANAQNIHANELNASDSDSDENDDGAPPYHAPAFLYEEDKFQK